MAFDKEAYWASKGKKAKMLAKVAETERKRIVTCALCLESDLFSIRRRAHLGPFELKDGIYIHVGCPSLSIK